MSEVQDEDCTDGAFDVPTLVGIELTDDPWETVEISDLLEPWRSRMTGLDVDIDVNDVMSLIVGSGQAQSIIRIEQVPGEDDSQALRQFVPHTRVFFHRPRAADLGWDATSAASVYLMMGSASLASALTLLRRTAQTFKLLNTEEMHMVLTMRGICGTRDRHRTTVSAADLGTVYSGTPTWIDAVMRSLVKKGAVVEADGGWRLVP